MKPTPGTLAPAGRLRLSAARMWQLALLLILPVVALSVVPFIASPFLAAKTVLLLLAGAVAVFAGGLHAPLHDKVFQLSAAGCAVVLLLSTLHARNAIEAWHVLAPMVAAAVILLAFVHARVSTTALLASIAVSALFVGFFAILGRFGFDLPRLLTGISAPGRMNAASTLGNPLFVASFLSCAMWALPGIKQLPVALRGAAMAAVFIATAATAERTAIIAFVAGAIVFLMLSNFSRRGLVTLAFVIATSVLFLAVSAENPRAVKTAVTGRVFLWKVALHTVTPMGAGPGSFYRVYNHNMRLMASFISPNEYHFVNYESDAYSIYVQTTIEEGISGLIVLLLFFAAWFPIGWRYRKDLSVRCAMAGITGFLAAGIFDDHLARPAGLALLAAWLAIPLLRHDEKAISAAPQIIEPNPANSTIQSSRLVSQLAKFTVIFPLAALLCVASVVIAFSSYAVHRGELAEAHRNWAQAEWWDRAAFRFDATQRDARYNLVRVLARSGNYESAWKESEQALRWVNEAELHLIRIRILPMMGRAKEAQRELSAARKEFPWSLELQTEPMPGSVSKDHVSPQDTGEKNPIPRG